MAIEFYGKARKGGNKYDTKDVSISLSRNTNSKRSKYAVCITIRNLPRRIKTSNYVKVGFDDSHPNRLYIKPSSDEGFKISHPNSNSKTSYFKSVGNERLTKWAKSRIGEYYWKFDEENDCCYIDAISFEGEFDEN